MVRMCDVIIIVFDALKSFTYRKLIEYELEGVGICLNKKLLVIIFNRKEKGGIVFMFNFNGKIIFLDEEMVKSICVEYKIYNVDVKFFADCMDEELIDVIEGNCIYIFVVYVVNKMDFVLLEEL